MPTVTETNPPLAGLLPAGPVSTLPSSFPLGHLSIFNIPRSSKAAYWHFVVAPCITLEGLLQGPVDAPASRRLLKDLTPCGDGT